MNFNFIMHFSSKTLFKMKIVKEINEIKRNGH